MARHATSAHTNRRPSLFTLTLFIWLVTLRNDDGVAGFQFDVLSQLLAFDHFLVIEFVAERLAVLGADHHDLFALGVVSEPAGNREHLQDSSGRRQRIRTWLPNLSRDEHPSAVYLFDDHRDVGILDVL